VTGTVDVVVVGAGHAGLAMSRCLSRRGIDHVVLERGLVANAWRRERWDSLRLLTPNWMTRLPDHGYTGADPDGYMSMPEVVRFISGYAETISAPVRCGVTVTSVVPTRGGYQVGTDRGDWRCRALVIATGACSRPAVPAINDALPAGVRTYTTRTYRKPSDLEPGGVLVVGSSATGLQLAQEIQVSGRPVTLAVGEHVRMPRLYRGRDIFWWMKQAGVLGQRYDEVDDIQRARRVPSPQLIGSPERATLDLNALRSAGVRTVGKLMSVRGGKALFSGSLRNHCAMADLKLGRLLDTFDGWIEESGNGEWVDPAERFEPTRVDRSPVLSLDVAGGEIRSVVWATGYRPDFGWLRLPVFDARGRLRHDGGVVDAPGLYVMGLGFMRRRQSSFIAGAEDDAADLSAHLSGYLGSLCGRGPVSVVA
jgi:putative flavoprotein involved in K+ transport